MDDTTGWVSAAAAMRTAQPAHAVPAAPTVEERARRVDAMLVRRCRTGEQQAWVELVDRFSSYVYAIGGRMLRGDDRVDDVYQEVFMRVYARLDSLEDEHALKPWIAQLTRRTAIDRLRTDAREQPAEDLGDAADTDAEMERIEEAMLVRRALDGLPEPFGEVLRRFFVEDQSYRTIGEGLGVPPGTVASRISRGLKLLRGALEEDGRG